MPESGIGRGDPVRLEDSFPPPLNQQIRFEFTDTGINADIEAEDVGEAREISFDPELIDVQPKSPIVDLVVRRIARREIDLQPDFQRHSGVWNERSQSRLIESLLLRIALPTIYVAEEDDDTWSVVDGVQRLSTIVRFVQPEAAGLEPLKLSDLEYLTMYNGCRFEDLPGRMQTRISETELSLLVIRKGTPEEAKFNIFARINTGGQPLSRQELRHALIPGPARKLLADLAGSEAFLEATTRSVSPTRMAERELCLRFLAFSLTPPERYDTKDFDGFLRDAMHTINRLPSDERELLFRGFEYAMASCRKVFGRHAFRKQARGVDSRYPVNKALFEVQSVLLSQCTPEEVEWLAASSASVRDKFLDLMDNPAFFDSVSSGTGDADKVNYRFQSMKDLIREVLHA
ncbi:DUF262 domain-containing protein [Streptomyces sp. MJP52]|uniref:DUF262 domain-containing protein n=1 Tax=Streptomyces sp. MJP52 TaxID=2940555 RepID=UPI002475EBF2|nr:DUF262 domain-containing protein [Streptomyces sp. MJP52]